MKIAVAQLNFIVADFDYNLKKITASVETAKKAKADIIVFSELAISGSPPYNLLNATDFLQKNQEVLNQVARQSKDIGILIGTAFRKENKQDKLFNAAVFLSEGEINFIQPKIILPTEQEANELQYFNSGEKVEFLTFKGKKILVSIGNGMCNNVNNTFNNRSDIDLHINITSSAFQENYLEERKNLSSTKDIIPFLSVNQVGANTGRIYTGGSFFEDKNKGILNQLPFFEEETAYIDTEKKADRAGTQIEGNEMICKALTLGIKDYFKKSGFKKAILGLSGGIDSALTLYLAVQALGKENVLAVMMPSMYSSDHSINDSIELADQLGCKIKKIPINSIYDSYINQLEVLFEGTSKDVTEENLQARIRGNLLMALSNKFGYMLLNTSNKSEIAVGYGTLYGDTCGSLSVLGDVYKIKVYELAKHINREDIIIPKNILSKAPSAELSPGQKDSNSLPDYDVLDPILFQYIEERKSLSEIINNNQYKDETLVEKVIKMVNQNDFKRYQLAPTLNISSNPFGSRKIPIVKGDWTKE